MPSSKNQPSPSHTLPSGRKRLSRLVREAGTIITIDVAVRALSLTRAQASKLLSRWVRQGWLRRVKAGTYLVASLEALDRDQVLDDPFILVPHLFEKSYIGGRTAAHHWDLTEQLFRDVVVFTATAVRESEQTLHGVSFTIYRIQEEKLFGVKTIWRERTKVVISDIHRTIIDMLDNPACGGGIGQVSDCLSAYLNGEDYDRELLVSYGDRLGNGAVFKRLGFLTERLAGDERLISDCRTRLTSGGAKLDPALQCPNLVTRWRLFVPENWLPERGA